MKHPEAKLDASPRPSNGGKQRRWGPKAGGTVVPERGWAESQPQQRSTINGLEPLDRPSGWPHCGWSATQSRSAKGVAHSGLRIVWVTFLCSRPERGCAESQPQQRPPFSGLEPLDRPSGWPHCCGWSSTQPRAARGVVHSGLRIVWVTFLCSRPERGCAESQPQQRPPFSGLEPLDRPSGWPHCCGWSSTQPRAARGVVHSGLRIVWVTFLCSRPERGCAESQPQQRSTINGLEPLDRPSGWPRVCDWSATQSRSAKGVAHSGLRTVWVTFLCSRPERGCAESQPQQRPPFSGLEPLDRPSGWPHCCGWSSTQPRSAKGVAHSGLRIVWVTFLCSRPERGCAESQPQQRPPFSGLEPLDRPSGWPHCCQRGGPFRALNDLGDVNPGPRAWAGMGPRRWR